MQVPIPTPILRLIHIDNLQIYLQRRGLHAPNREPNNGLIYRTIHNIDIQLNRRIRRILLGPQGVIHDYVAYYFGPRSPMLFQLHTGRVEGYLEGQEPLIYLVSTAQAVQESGTGFVFSNGHGIVHYTDWFYNLNDLDKVDWETVYGKIWLNTVEDMDRQRRKQAEFMVYQFCDWSLIHRIAVINETVKSRVETILQGFPADLHKPVEIRREWYY
ncbi:MAG: DUF4433 domain-containing protein [Candidatus Glassbacteria bacterium]|nr:DUF4433 domain-containing protein [Candidatus Glassbacteria bacterium]